MKLLVFASTPPPFHGQSLAVQALLDTLRADPAWDVRHVNPRLSRDTADIGRWRPRKVLALLAACVRCWGITLRGGRRVLYYVPAPAKRAALYRDWLVLALCRPFADRLVLHWHAVGLGEWLDTRATGFERRITRRLLGRADLAIAQADAGRDDCERLAPRRCVVIRNGVPDPAPDFSPRRLFRSPCEVLFAGLGCREKGLFDALAGVILADAAAPGAFRFTAVGPFASTADERDFRAQLAAAPPGLARHLGFVSAAERNRELHAADLFCFPSYYPHEGQPTVLFEALALDLPIITTRWRGIAENLPTARVFFVDPRSPGQIAAQLAAARRAGPATGEHRRHYLAHFTKQRHHEALLAALRSV